MIWESFGITTPKDSRPSKLSFNKANMFLIMQKDGPETKCLANVF